MIVLSLLFMALAVYATVSGGGGGGSHEYQGVKKLVKKIIKNRNIHKF
jgi:hypothetical protein